MKSAFPLFMGLGLTFPFLDGDVQRSAESSQKVKSVKSPAKLTPHEEALALYLKRVHEASRIAERHGLIVQGKSPWDVNCKEIGLSVRQGAVYVHQYDEKGSRQSARVALSSDVEDAYRVPKRPGVWVVRREGIVEFSEKVPPDGLCYLIRTRNGTVRVVDMETGETAWVPGQKKKSE